MNISPLGIYSLIIYSLMAVSLYLILQTIAKRKQKKLTINNAIK